ncbi:MAG: response regulator [Verrucomicrobia bacterium]|nr:response regulator [Verrucomicrobiota bacterium]
MKSQLLRAERQPDILVVDDTPANLELLTEILKSNGYKVRPVTGGASALQAARSAPPDLILLDINMPGMNGYEVCMRLKADGPLKGVPVLFISALGDKADKVTAFQCGGVDYITKPFWVDEVLARVKTHLRLRQLQLEVETHNARLEETVRIRTREITEARDQLAEANERLAILDKAKSDFLSLISHELRTPLNGLFGITDLILNECRSLPSMEAICGHFNSSRDKILTIVADSLLLTQINVEAERFAQAPTSLSLALLNAKERSLEFARSYNVDIGPFPIVTELVIGEPELLSKALEALLETGVRFSKPGSVMNLFFSPSESGVLLIIETTGRLISKELIPQFFDVLAIGEAIVPGGDLGLRPAVAERIIALFGGSVTVENLDPNGIRLNVRLKSAS